MKLLPIKYNWSCIVVQVTTRCWGKKKKKQQKTELLFHLYKSPNTLTAQSLVQRRFASAKISLVIFIHS